MALYVDGSDVFETARETSEVSAALGTNQCLEGKCIIYHLAAQTSDEPCISVQEITEVC